MLLLTAGRAFGPLCSASLAAQQKVGTCKALGKDPVQSSSAKVELSCLSGVPVSCDVKDLLWVFGIYYLPSVHTSAKHCMYMEDEVPDLRRVSQQDWGHRGWVLKIKVQACQCGLKKNAWKEGFKGALCI